MVRAIATIPELRQILPGAPLISTKTELLSSAATQYDAGLQNKPKRIIIYYYDQSIPFLYQPEEHQDFLQRLVCLSWRDVAFMQD